MATTQDIIDLIENTKGFAHEAETEEQATLVLNSRTKIVARHVILHGQKLVENDPESETVLMHVIGMTADDVNPTKMSPIRLTIGFRLEDLAELMDLANEVLKAALRRSLMESGQYTATQLDRIEELANQIDASNMDEITAQIIQTITTGDQPD